MVSPIQYVREVNQELQKVSWPSRQQTIQMTALVIGVSALVGLYIAGLDVLFQYALRILINR
ncbi:MAG TPA: preprotein translocase subunit SecE [Vitreimonas sp.]|nr:preprotein translocase subunit SecE [Vitreimonas sp.]